MSSLLAQAGQPSGAQIGLVIAIVFIALIVLFAFILFAKYFNLWIQAKMTHANVGIFDLIGMSFRKVNPNIIVRSKIMAIQAGLTEKDGLTTRGLEAHYPRRRQRSERRPGADRGESGRHPTLVQAGRRDRPGRGETCSTPCRRASTRR